MKVFEVTTEFGTVKVHENSMGELTTSIAIAEREEDWVTLGKGDHQCYLRKKDIKSIKYMGEVGHRR